MSAAGPPQVVSCAPAGGSEAAEPRAWGFTIRDAGPPQVANCAPAGGSDAAKRRAWGFNSSTLIAGIDEAGRGPLAGPVVAAAVILNPEHEMADLRDSKVLTAEARERLAIKIRAEAVAWAVAHADVAEIDAMNILQASLLAMRRAVAALSIAPTQALVDGDRCPDLGCPARAVIKGDRDVPSISAASILAKTARDAMLIELDRLYPAYGFAQHKGYATREHLAALTRHGPCPAHRRFMPVVQPSLDFGDSILPEPQTRGFR